MSELWRHEDLDKHDLPVFSLRSPQAGSRLELVAHSRSYPPSFVSMLVPPDKAAHAALSILEYLANRGAMPDEASERIASLASRFLS